MELTKKQIQYIENRLINEGVKYWDIRIEMLDHIVTNVENQLKIGVEFNEAVQISMVNLGWKENFNGSNFECIMQRKQTVFAKIYKNKFHSFIKEHFSKTSFIVLALSFLICLYFISFNVTFLKIILFSYLSIMISFLFYFLVKYRVYRSIQLGNALTQTSFSLTFINAFIYIPKIFQINILEFPIFVTIFFGLISIISFLGIKFFIKEYRKVNHTYKKLLS